MSEFFGQQAPEREKRRYSHPNSDSMYQRPEKPKKPEIPVGERKYPNSKKIYGDQPKDAPMPGRQVILSHLTDRPVMDQPGYLGEFGYKRAVANHARELQHADIRGKDLSDISVNKGNFEGSKMHDVSFKKSRAQDANFSNSDLSGVNFDGCNLNNASFRNAKGLETCSFRGAILRGCDLRNVTLPAESDMEGADLTNAILSDSD